jgi:hypothetical protein
MQLRRTFLSYVLGVSFALSSIAAVLPNIPPSIGVSYLVSKGYSVENMEFHGLIGPHRIKYNGTVEVSCGMNLILEITHSNKSQEILTHVERTHPSFNWRSFPAPPAMPEEVNTPLLKKRVHVSEPYYPIPSLYSPA